MTRTTRKTAPPIPLDELVQNYRILIDTNMLMGWKVGELIAELRRQQRQAIVPLSVVQELERLSQSGRRAVLAADALRRLQALVAEKVIELRGEADDPDHADDLFVKVCRKFANHKKICVLTQDRGLKNRLRNIHRTNILVLGALPKRRTHVPRFRLATTITRVPDQAVRIDSVPSLGEACYEQGKNKKLVLREKIAEGGEGIVYKVNANTACKIYYPHRLTQRRLEKLRRMTKRPLRISGVCWPRKLVCNDRRQVVGYTMPLAAGTPVQRCVYLRPLLEQHFPYWTREHLLALARCWLEKVMLLHRENVLLGDINPQNFLVVDEANIWFVDCDSYQIEEFPCPVGTVTFTPPELQGKNFTTFLRGFEHEHFAVATFLFMLLLPGKPPYSHTGGEDPATNIRQGKFPYTPRKTRIKRKDTIPLGAWRYMWSHLPDYLQEAFYRTFTSSDPRQRLDSAQWLELLDRYQEDLLQGRLCPTREGLKIYPQRLRVRSEQTSDNKISTNCATCGKGLKYTKQSYQKFLSEHGGCCSQCRQTKRKKTRSTKRKKTSPQQQTQSTWTPSPSATSTWPPSPTSTPSSPPQGPELPWGWILGAIAGLLVLLGLYFLGCGEESPPTARVQATFSFYLSISPNFSPDALGSTGEYYLLLQTGKYQWRIPEEDEVAIVSGGREHLGDLVLEVPPSSTIPFTTTVYEEDLLQDDEVGSGRWTLQTDPQYPTSHQKIDLPGGNTLEITVRITEDE